MAYLKDRSGNMVFDVNLYRMCNLQHLVLPSYRWTFSKDHTVVFLKYHRRWPVVIINEIRNSLFLLSLSIYICITGYSIAYYGRSVYVDMTYTLF